MQLGQHLGFNGSVHEIGVVFLEQKYLDTHERVITQKWFKQLTHPALKVIRVNNQRAKPAADPDARPMLWHATLQSVAQAPDDYLGRPKLQTASCSLQFAV